MEGSYTYEDNSTTIVTFYYDVVDGVGGFYHNGQCLNSEIADLATNAIESIRDGGKYGKMLVDAIVNDDRSIVLTPTITKPNQSWCLNDVLIWNLKDFDLGDLHVPSYIALCHEFAHFISFWYGFADLNTWYKDVLNDEKWAVNVENLIRKENHLETRRYYDMPSTTGGLGEGEIPQWNWIGNYLKILSNF